jgi:predicted DNA-binding transcriptional regulator AlpA
MADRILRPSEARRALGNISNSTLYLWVKEGKLPAPSKIVPGGRASGWPESTINALIAGMVERSKAA